MTTQAGEGSPPPLPPSTNRGAGITGGGVSIDWLEFSSRLPTDEVRTQLSADAEDWLALKHGALGYRRGELNSRGARLLWDEDRPETHATLTGSACRYLSERDALALVEWVVQQGDGAGF